MIRSLPAVMAVALSACTALMPRAGAAGTKLDRALLQRAHARAGVSRVIVRAAAEAPVEDILRAAGAVPVRALGARQHLALVPDAALASLAQRDAILAMSLDRPVSGALSPQSPAAAAQAQTTAAPDIVAAGLDGSGVGIAAIDSGISMSHGELAAARVIHWSDFVNHLPTPYDDYGHGTHVAGILAGSGVTASGTRRGIAPGADLIVVKALDSSGYGHVSDVISAIDYVIDNRSRFNIRVVNLSVAAGVYESYRTDPLTLAALRAVNAGIVVVASAGNAGTSPVGEPQYGTIAAPGNAPWVLTIGASDDRGTADRADDGIAAFSSRGPSAIDASPKPDLVAPGVGILSTADAGATLFALNPRARVWGAAPGGSEPYLRLSGTSMSAPTVAGTVALMLQADPALTPNAVKAILQFTAEPRGLSNEATRGAGLLNPDGAVAVARQFASRPVDGSAVPTISGTELWGRRIIWGARHIVSPTLAHDAAAWQPGVLWGSDTDAAGRPVTWGAMCAPTSALCGGQ